MYVGVLLCLSSSCWQPSEAIVSFVEWLAFVAAFAGALLGMLGLSRPAGAAPLLGGGQRDVVRAVLYIVQVARAWAFVASCGTAVSSTLIQQYP